MDTDRRNALVVEDDPKLRRAMGRELRQMGLDVLEAGHYDAAVGHLAVAELHLICIDVGLPNKSGYELCEHIRGAMRLAELPILMTSDHGNPGDLAQAENAGGNAFLHKPFSMRELGRCIESLFAVSPRIPLSFELQLRVSRTPVIPAEIVAWSSASRIPPVRLEVARP
jgi:DNA-binding response OmpR family regulator